MYTQEQLKQKMAEVAPLPKTATEVRALREKMLNARDAIPEYEQRIAEALRTKHTWNIDALEACLETARATFTDSQRELRRIAPAYIIALEAAENAKKQAAAQEHQREQAQLEFAKSQEAEAKAQFQARFLTSGGTVQSFEAAWPAMWTEELKRRTIAGTHTLEARMVATGKYS